MPPSRHGRRRALPGDHSPRRTAARLQAPSPRPAWLPGVSAFAAVVMLAAGIPAAHAGLIAAGTVTAAQPAVAEAAPAVAAQAQAVITYPRTEVGTRPADPPAAPAATGSTAGTPAAAAAPPAKAPVDTTLGAPLASMSISSPFGFRTSPITGGAGELHTGLDLVASCQTAVFTAGSGTVAEAGWSQNGGGNRIVIDHGNGMKSTYNHLSSIETSIGAVVAKGQRLAGAGTTGNSTGCHLHFEIVRNGTTVDPQGWLRS